MRLRLRRYAVPRCRLLRSSPCVSAPHGDENACDVIVSLLPSPASAETSRASSGAPPAPAAALRGPSLPFTTDVAMRFRTTWGWKRMRRDRFASAPPERWHQAAASRSSASARRRDEALLGSNGRSGNEAIVDDVPWTLSLSPRRCTSFIVPELRMSPDPPSRYRAAGRTPLTTPDSKGT